MKILLDRMKVSLDKDGLAYYQLNNNDVGKIDCNSWIGKKLAIRFLNKKICVECGKEVEALFRDGSCEDCFRTMLHYRVCMRKPELCDINKCIDKEFAKEFCFKPMFVYFSLTSGLKVGYSTEPIRRWIDQGAIAGILVAKLPSRKKAGELEYFFSRRMKDKTNWSSMLKGVVEETDLLEIKKEKIKNLPEYYKKIVIKDSKIYKISYPVFKYPSKVTQIHLDKTPVVESILYGIKGRYLIFEDKVLNIQSHQGYLIEISVKEAAKNELKKEIQSSLF